MPPKPSRQLNPNAISLVAGAILLVAMIMRLISWINPPVDPPLLAQAPSLVRIANTTDPKLPSTFKQLLPTQTFGGTIRVIGLYPEGAEHLPKNSISVVYERDAWRMMQVDLLPATTLVDTLGPYNTYKQDRVVLPGNKEGTMVNIKLFLDCMKANTKEGIGSCDFTRVLVFEIESGLIGRITVDGDKVTDGELIEIARSMVKSIQDVSP